MTGASDILEEFLRRIDEQTGEDGIASVLSDNLRSLGFEWFSYCGLRKNIFYCYCKAPDEFMERFSNNDYYNYDALVQRATQSIEPFTTENLRAHPNTEPLQHRILDEAAETGLSHIGTIPIHARETGPAFLAVATSSPYRSFQAAWRANWPLVQAMAMALHERIERVRSDLAEGAKRQLTTREREVLLWTARGKSAWEVSVILNISQETVNYHLQNAALKLNTTGKTHTVVTAIMQGMIVP